MEQLKLRVEALQQQEKDLLQKLRSSEESFQAVSQEKDNLKMMVEDLQVEKDTMEHNMSRLYKSIEKTVAANLELQEQLRAATRSSRGCRETQWGTRRATLDKSTQLSEGQEKLGPATEEVNQKLEQLNAQLSLQVSEKRQVLAENEQMAEKMQHVMMDNAHLKKVMDDFWQTVLSLRMENDHLRCMLIVFTEKSVVEKLPVMENKKEYIAIVALNLKSDLDGLKALVAKACCNLSRGNAAHIKKLHRQYEQTANELYVLLNDIKHYFSNWYTESNNYYVSISKYTMDLLEENLKQLKLLMQIQILKKADQYGDEFKELDIPALRKKLDIFLENIFQDISTLEEELFAIEAKARQLESCAKEVKQFLERCSLSFSMKDFEEGIGSNMERLHHVLEALKQKSQKLIKARSEVVIRHASYCRESEGALQVSRARSEQRLQELKALQEEKTGTAAALAAECGLEEAKKPGTNLTVEEQVITAQPAKGAEETDKDIEDLAIQLAKADTA